MRRGRPLQPTGSGPPPAPPRAIPFDAVLALLAWAGLILLARAIVQPLRHGGHRVIGNAPLLGMVDPKTTWLLLPALGLAAAAVVWGPPLAAKLRWRWLLAVSALAAFAWAMALAGSDGVDHIAAPLRTPYEYLHDVPLVDRMPDFLHTFAPLAPLYAFHVHSHPPLMLLVLWAMSKAGLGGASWAAILVVGGGAITAPAALVTVRELAGEGRARAAAPFLVFAPAALWIATSPDAFFAGTAALGIALFAHACRRPADAAGDGSAFGAGLVLGAALFLSYGVVTLGLIVVAIAAYLRRIRPLLLAAGGVLAVALAFLAGGFWWYDGLQAARDLQLGGIYRERPYAEFLLNGPAAFALVIGPAAAVGLARVRERGLWVIVAPAIAGLLLADLSGFTRGETERVWLQFAPWFIVAAGALSASLRTRRAWLALQVATTLVLQVVAKGPW